MGHSGYYILSWSLNEGATWVDSGAMLWASARRAQRRIATRYPSSISAIRHAFSIL
jgi:hypothetical protein